MFKTFLNKAVSIINRIHTLALTINDNNVIKLSDKQLHFIFVGMFGLGLLMLIYPIFNYLVKKNKTIAITWIYVLTILIAFTLAIEVGQKITGTGDMDFADIVAGILGYFVISAIFIIFRKIYISIQSDKEKK